MGLRDLRTHWPRHLVTALAMLLGVLGVVAISVTASVAADMMIAQEEQLNGREATYAAEVVTSKDLVPAGLSTGSSRVTELFRTLAARIGPQDASVVLHSATSMTLRTEREKKNNLRGTGVLVTWVMGDLDEVQRLPVLSGAVPAANTYPLQLAVNEAAAHELGVPSNSTFFVSSTPWAHDARFTISAVVADGQRDPMAYGRYETAMDFYSEELGQVPTVVKVRAPASALHRVDALISSATANNQLALASTTTRVDSVESVRHQVEFLTWVFGSCATLVLLASAMGIANVGIASVAERSRELVVRRSVGARRRDVFMQMMAASLAVGVLVALFAATAAVVGVYWVVPAIIPAASSIVSPAFPWVACLFGFGSSLLTSVIGAVLPAIKATRLPVALALRE